MRLEKEQDNRNTRYSIFTLLWSCGPTEWCMCFKNASTHRPKLAGPSNINDRSSNIRSPYRSYVSLAVVFFLEMSNDSRRAAEFSLPKAGCGQVTIRWYLLISVCGSELASRGLRELLPLTSLPPSYALPYSQKACQPQLGSLKEFRLFTSVIVQPAGIEIRVDAVTSEPNMFVLLQSWRC